MSVAAGWRGLSRGMQAFLLVDALLVVLLVVVLAVTLPGRGGGGGAAASADGTASSSPSADAAPTAPAATVAFGMPSGNIACEMSAEGVLCTIGSFTYAQPQVTGCEAATGHVVRLDADGFRFVCEDDGVPPVTPTQELAYGASEQVGGWTCASGTDGVTCTDAAGVGFRLARAQWVTLP